MTAVAPPLTITAGSRAWTAGSAAPNSMDQDVSRMFMPRRPITRTGSSSSINSNSSTATVTQTTEGQQSGPYDSSRAGSEWNAKPKLARGLWTSKAEPTVGLTGARTNGITNGAPTPNSMALTQSTPLVPSQHVVGSQSLPAMRAGQNPETPAVLFMTPLNATFAKKTIHVPYYPDVLKIGRQTNARTVPTTTNGYFDSKVLSRQHAEIYADKTGIIWIRDIKSSNGTFVNGQRLSPENRESEPHELHENDTLELGIDIISEDQKTVVHHKVAARVEHAGLYTGPLAGLDLTFGAQEQNSLAQQQRRRDFLNGPAGPQPQPLTRNGINTTMPAAGAMVPGSKTNFWIHPVTMEQIVKKLTVELRAAKQQSTELHQTATFFDNILDDPNKPHTNGVPEETTEPPAPTKLPSPEKPVAAQKDQFFPSLNRSDTERPEGLGTPDLSFLSTALAETKRSLEEQTARVKNLEIMLMQERSARESAENRASKLEEQQETTKLPEAAVASTKSIESTATTRELESDPSDEAERSTARMHARVEQMAVEMDEMRKALEGYKKRAEKAEAERDFSRKNLAEMVERLRKEEDSRKAAEEKAIMASAAAAAAAVSAEKSSSTPKASIDIGDRDLTASGSSTLTPNGELAKRSLHQNGKTPHPGEALQASTGLSHVLARRDDGQQAILASAPYASVIGVIAIGLSVMALLNRWQKTEQ